MTYSVYTEYDIVPVCIVGAGVTDEADFAAFAVAAGYTEREDYSAFGGNVQYHNPSRLSHPAFIVKVGEFNDLAVAQAVAGCIGVAGRSTG